MRKKVTFVLKTVIRATFGNSINRKVDAAIDAATSTEQVAEYIIQFRDAWWPNGVQAPEASERSQDCRTRTRVEAKSKLLGMLPDELKTIIGTKTALTGILRWADHRVNADLSLAHLACLLFADGGCRPRLLALRAASSRCCSMSDSTNGSCALFWRRC